MNKEKRNMRFNYWSLVIGILLVLGILVIGNCSFAAAKGYDGIWFMGFNLNQELFKDPEVRKAFNATVDKEYVITEIVTQDSVPVSVIPPGMLGYDPDLEPNYRDVKYAKLLMTKAGYPMNDQRLKNLSLLHTDGVKTVNIAKKIQNDLRSIGVKVSLVEIPYQKETKWIRELVSGKHDLFLMGYKAGVEQLFATEEAAAVEIDSASLVGPLFKTEGDANFTNYTNSQVDKLLDQISGFNLALKSERHNKLKQINQQLYKDLPVVVLFYIEKL